MRPRHHQLSSTQSATESTIHVCESRPGAALLPTRGTIHVWRPHVSDQSRSEFSGSSVPYFRYICAHGHQQFVRILKRVPWLGSGLHRAPPGSTVRLIDPSGNESSTQYPCFEHPTLTDLLSTLRASHGVTTLPLPAPSGLALTQSSTCANRRRRTANWYAPAVPGARSASRRPMC